MTKWLDRLGTWFIVAALCIVVGMIGVTAVQERSLAGLCLFLGLVGIAIKVVL